MGEPELRRRRLRPPSAAATKAAQAAQAAAGAKASEADAAAKAPDAATAAKPPDTATAAKAPDTATAAKAPDTATADVAAADAVGRDATASATMAVEDPDQPQPARPRPRLPRAPTSGAGYVDERDVERGLRGLVGSGSSQVSVGAALRARDAARPTEEHLAEAERGLAIVRRNWSPPA